MGFKKRLLGALVGNYKTEMELLNEFCEKKGLDMRKAALAYQEYGTRLVEYGAKLEVQK